jgi:protease-4
MSTATKVLLAMTLVGGLGFVVLSAGAVYLAIQADKADVGDSAFLDVVLAGSIADAPTSGDLFVDPSAAPMIPTTIARGIRKAATDDRITGVYLELASPSIGFANIQELRDALLEFRKSGKPCVAYSESYEMGTYYLASACDKIVIAPSGVTLVGGIGTSITYYAGTFEWLGIQPQFEHVGNFKSAVEPYTRSGPSDGALEAYNSMFDALYGKMVADIASGRGKTEDDVKALIDNPPMSPEDALSRGLIDAVAYPDAVEAHLADIKAADYGAKLAETTTAPDDEKETHDERFTKASEYLKEIAEEDAGKSEFVAVIHAEGPITGGDDSEGGLFANQTLTDGAFHKWMREAREDDEVKAIVLRVNSPGGSGLASDNMWRDIELTKAAGKPVVVSQSNYAASGGYYISCNADWVVSDPSTLTGSIGVFGGKMALKGSFEKLGMTEYSFKRGELSDLFSMSEPFSDAGREVFRSYLEDFYQTFLGRVAAGRHRTKEEIHEVAQGRVWTGDQALERGLVDQIGGLDVAVAKAAELGKTSDYGLRRWPRQKGFFDLLLEDLDENASAPKLEVHLEGGIPGADEALAQAMLLDKVLAGNGIAAYDPALLEIGR